MRSISVDGSGPLGVNVRDADGNVIPTLSLRLEAQPDDIVRAHLELPIQVLDQVTAQAICYHDGREVKRIEYADGEVAEF